MEPLQHFCHPEHPLVFNQDDRRGEISFGCSEPVLGPSYSCKECGEGSYTNHKSCVELPLGLHHPLHPIHPLILFDQYTNYPREKEKSKCEVYKESRIEYIYRCYHCDFNLQVRCGSFLTLEAEFHDHPLTLFCNWITFTCNICGKEGKGVLISHRLKVVHRKHPLHITHSSIELHEFDSRFCQLCVQKVDTRYGLYYCSKCDFVAYLNCAIDKRNREDINLLELKDGENEDVELDQSIESAVAYKVKNIKVGEDGTKIATEIEHFSHEHDLKLIDERVHNNEKCNGYRMFWCRACSFLGYPGSPDLLCNGFSYNCKTCDFDLDIQCSLTLDVLTHKGHQHRLILSSTNYLQSCSSCGSESNQVFRCITCEFALDYKCATLPQTTRYKQHEHSFTPIYKVEDDFGEYYCDICEEERNSNHWFYFCADCTYPAHPKCILVKYTNFKFGGAYTFNCHQHPLTFIEEIEDPPPCHICSRPCKELIYRCVPCNCYIHLDCV
ncbi:hypothetical protein ACB092_03G034300 [Castanea dentata]